MLIYQVKSKAFSRDVYLQRPDWGRLLHDDSVHLLKSVSATTADIAIVIADGLSATAINENALSFIEAFLQYNQHYKYTIAPVVIAEQARVAIADEIGYLLQARLTIILIGERPGLSAADSMGAYLTFGPQPGNTDEKRNCISNIRTGGLLPDAAAFKVINIVNAAFALQITGVHLKEKGGHFLP